MTKKKKRKKAPPPKPLKKTDWRKVLSVWGIIIMSLHFLSLFVFPEIFDMPEVFERTWGFHFISYFSTPVIILFYLIGFGVCIPPVNRKIVQVFESFFSGDLQSKLAKHKYLLFTAAGLIAIPIFWALRAKYGFLGDGYLRVQNALQKEFIRNEFGCIYLLHYFHKLLNVFTAVDGSTSFAVYSCLTGGLFVFFLLVLADELGKTFLQKAAIFLFVISFGTIQHFFGYIEVYGIVIDLLLLYIYLSIVVIRDRLHVIVPLILLILAFMGHFVTITFFPSYLFLFYAKVLWKIPLFRKRSTFIVLGIISLPFIYFAGKKYVLPLLMPLLPKPDGRLTLFSPVHFWEFFNGQVLASGMGIIVLFVLIFLVIKKKMRLNLTIWFLIVTSVFPFLNAFAHEEVRGSGDWDLASIPAIPYMILAAYLLFSLYREKVYVKILKHALLIIIVFTFINTLPWVIINSTDKSIDMFADMIETDPGRYYIDHPAPMVLSIIFNTAGLEDEAFEQYKKGYEQYPNDPRMYNNYAGVLMGKNRYEEALPILEKCFEKFPYYANGLRKLLLCYEQLNMPDKAFSALQMFFFMLNRQEKVITSFYDPGEMLQYGIALSQRYAENNYYTEAENILLKLKELLPGEAAVYYNIALLKEKTGNYDEVINISRQIISQVPKYPNPYPLLARTYEKKNMKKEAIEVLEQYMQFIQNEEQKKQISEEIERLRK